MKQSNLVESPVSVTAINHWHQRHVGGFLREDSIYNSAVNEYDANDIDDDKRPKQERAYNNACTYWEMLPKREQKNISKFIDTTGY